MKTKLLAILLFLALTAASYGAAYAVSTPYDGNDLALLQYAQLNDVMYLVHPDYQPYKLIRAGHTDWTMTAIDFETGPFLPINDTSTTITPSATTGTITLTASSSIFDDPGHVDSIWQIDQKRGSSTFQGTIDATETSSTTYYFTGTYSFVTEGTFDGTVTLERSENGTDWEAALTPLTNINYENYSEVEDDVAKYRVRGSAWGSGACNYTITISDNYNHGIVKITDVASGTSATATVLTKLYSDGATKRWYEPCFSGYRGWPRAVAFYQQRLVLAGTDYQPTTIWASQSFDYENFDIGSGLDNHAIDYTITIAKQNPILWLYDLDAIVVGTAGSILTWGPPTSSDPLTPSNATTKRLSNVGVAPIQPSYINESLLFVERGGHKINELSYRLESDGYVSSDLNLLATHIAKQNTFIETAVMSRPYPILWCERSDGVMPGLSFQKQQGVTAWHRQVTDGEVRSVCTIPGPDEDELWMIVDRTIDGNNVSYVERMEPFNWGTDPNDCWFVDCGVKYGDDAGETATTTITGLTWLEGETVQVFKGDSYETATVSGGSITITESIGYPNSECTIGLPYTSTLKTMPLEIQSQEGFTIGRSKRLKQMFVAFEDTMKFEYSESTKETYWPVTFEDRSDILTPTTGYRPMLNVTGINDFEVSIIFRQQWPYPTNILAVYPNVDYSK